MAKETFQRHRITLQSGASSTDRASAWGRALAAGAGWPEERTYALDLCIVEMVSNVVDHSYRGSPGEITLELDLAPTAGVLTIFDHGPAFDPLSVPPPAAPTSLEEAPLGGYGIHMVRTTAQECRYERRDGRNVFTAIFSNPR